MERLPDSLKGNDLPSPRDLYDIARDVTNEVFGEGTFERLHRNNPDPGIQRAIKRAKEAETDKD